MRPHLRPTPTGSRWLMFAASLLIVFAAVPLHAQYTYQDLYDFDCNVGGCFPVDLGSLTQVYDGTFWATGSSGPGKTGSDFDLTLSSPATFTDFGPFSNSMGTNPTAGMTLAYDGTVWGANASGCLGYGAVFGEDQARTWSVVHCFTATEGTPSAAPTQAWDGNLYGTTTYGLIYQIAPPSYTYTVLAGVTPGTPVGQLLAAFDKNLYGTTINGGKYGDGVIFSLSIPGNVIKVLHEFNGSDGAQPYAQLMEAPDENLYGTTLKGGANNSGVVFQLAQYANFHLLYSFDALDGFCNQSGGQPVAGLTTAHDDGYLLGVTVAGGTFCAGTIFQISTITAAYSKLFDFSGLGGAVPGEFPETNLTWGTDGSIYGFAVDAAANNNGTYFRLVPQQNQIPILKVAGPIFVLPGTPVQILGNNLSHVAQLNFGAVQAEFQPDSDTHFSATVPSQAIDAPISAIMDTGLPVQTQMSVHILPTISNLDPSSGAVGSVVNVSGGGFSRASKLVLGKSTVKTFTVLAPNLIQAVIPKGAKSGQFTVTTPNGTASSAQSFTVN